MCQAACKGAYVVVIGQPGVLAIDHQHVLRDG
jgi:hypothetical protein